MSVKLSPVHCDGEFGLSKDKAGVAVTVSKICIPIVNMTLVKSAEWAYDHNNWFLFKLINPLLTVCAKNNFRAYFCQCRLDL